jgi:hypothetical protein
LIFERLKRSLGLDKLGPKIDRKASVFTKRTIRLELLDLELFLTPDK